MKNKTKWIWYPGDMELYYAMKQNFSRVERGMGWPAFWKSEGFRNRIVLRHSYDLKEETSFVVLANADAVGHVVVGERKYPLGTEIHCQKGMVRISVHLGSIASFPAACIIGDVIRSDETWMAEDYARDPVPAGSSPFFEDAKQDPSVWTYSEKIFEPVRVEQHQEGTLFSFSQEMTAVVELEWRRERRPCKVYIGETKAEALDTENCYCVCVPGEDGACEKNAVHYVYVTNCAPEDVRVRARHQYVDLPVQVTLDSPDPKLRRIWEVAEHTFRLCSGIFFLDGVKRDRWIWGGDAYQSMFVNRCLFQDADIDRRTYRALFGNAPAVTHINTILDYSLLCVIGVKEHYAFYQDRAFLAEMFPKMESVMALCGSQEQEQGFVTGRERDWEFIDWADFDRTGPLAAEQMLYAAALKAMEQAAAILDLPDKAGEYRERYAKLKEAIDRHYWDEEKGAYVDSFVSGRRHVTRHANIFAIRYDLTDQGRKERILKEVLLNPGIPAITTPYFQFFELEALCSMGRTDQVLETILSYWGGMLDLGADTFWEEYDPRKKPEQQYEMYGDPYGKSMCHAWAASPIYLLARYFDGKHGITIHTGQGGIK